MKGSFWGRACITLGLFGSVLLAGECILNGHLMLGLWLFLIILALLIVVVVIISRVRKNDEEMDPLSDAGKTMRFVKSHKTKPVYDNDSSIWDQMKGSGDTDSAK